MKYGFGIFLCSVMLTLAPVLSSCSESFSETDATSDEPSVEMQQMGGGNPGGDPPGDAQPGGPGGASPDAGGPGGNFGTIDQGTAAYTIDTSGTYENETYESIGDNENALRVTGDIEVTLAGITVNKSAGATFSAENGDFYGINAALLTTDGSHVTISNATVTSQVQGGNGVFSYGSGTEVSVSDSTIITSGDNSGGIQTTGGGTTNALNLTVSTAGNSAAAIRSDRGGGIVNVSKGSYTSSGFNSPAVYSTAQISVEKATLTAKNSEALVIEGKNSISLTDCTVSGNMSDTYGSSSNINVHNVMIYQSMSGDAEVGNSVFDLINSTLTSHNGDVFYVTNTTCSMTLENSNIINEDADSNLITVSGNSAANGWGQAGQNGAQLDLVCRNQKLEGRIEVDSISTLNIRLSGSSVLDGVIDIVDNAQGGTAVGNNAAVTIDAGATWDLMSDCAITSLTNNGVINYNGHTITLADGTVLRS